MGTSVIIPAYNAESTLGGTLTSLPADRVEPIVAVNGSNDNSVAVAESFGCEVLDLPEAGKLPAVQTALKHLGKKALEEPVIILDADTHPVAPTLWHDQMVKSLTTDKWGERPQAVGGPVLYTARNALLGLLRSGYRIIKSARLGPDPDTDTVATSSAARSAQYGPNMGVFLKNQTTLDTILSLTHFWPGEDRAIVVGVLANNGHFSQELSPKALTLSPLSVAYPSLRTVIKKGVRQARADVHNAYDSRGPANSQPFVGQLMFK